MDAYENVLTKLQYEFEFYWTLIIKSTYRSTPSVLYVMYTKPGQYLVAGWELPRTI